MKKLIVNCQAAVMSLRTRITMMKLHREEVIRKGVVLRTERERKRKRKMKRKKGIKSMRMKKRKKKRE